MYVNMLDNDISPAPCQNQELGSVCMRVTLGAYHEEKCKTCFVCIVTMINIYISTIRLIYSTTVCQ